MFPGRLQRRFPALKIDPGPPALALGIERAGFWRPSLSGELASVGQHKGAPVEGDTCLMIRE
jgi:hypothetical protein